MLERCAEESKGTERTDNVAEQAGLNPTPWTPDEQKLLEQVGPSLLYLDSLYNTPEHICLLNMYVSSQVLQALKTYDSKTPERWERISESVPGRSKKDCMKR